jgi:uncharacterized damage-inducible protein DinB
LVLKLNCKKYPLYLPFLREVINIVIESSIIKSLVEKNISVVRRFVEMSLSMEKKLEYHHWANMKLLNHINSLGEGIFRKEVRSVFPSIAAIFEHVFQVDVLWLNRILGGNSLMFDDLKFEIPLMAIHYFEELHQQYKRLNSATEIITYKNSKGIEFQNRVGEIVDHLMNHGTYHRGNVTAVLHQLGEVSVSTDLILLLR